MPNLCGCSCAPNLDFRYRYRRDSYRSKGPASLDVRGSGLFFGAELVVDPNTREADPNLAQKVVNEMRNEGILINRIGINYNTLKIRPNLQFTKENADLLVDTLEKVLARIKKSL